jgi:hypothetical protein
MLGGPLAVEDGDGGGGEQGAAGDGGGHDVILIPD